MTYASQALKHATAAKKIAEVDQPFQWNFTITLRCLGEAQMGAGRPKEARESFEKALQADQKSVAATNSLAWLLATSWESETRNGERAIRLATGACELTGWSKRSYLYTLAAAYAEAGQFDKAVEWQDNAMKLPNAPTVTITGGDGTVKWQIGAVEVPDSFDEEEFEQARERLKLYESHQPYHVPEPEPDRRAG